MFLAVRTAGDPASLVAPLRDLLTRKDPSIPLAEPATMASIVDDALADVRVVTLALGLFSAVALARRRASTSSRYDQRPLAFGSSSARSNVRSRRERPSHFPYTASLSAPSA